MSGSYKLSSFTENQEAEVTRLKAQVELFFDKEFEIFQKLGLKDGMNIIECGSGPGYLILNILKQLPNCKATALEIDPFLFDVLTINSEQAGRKIYDPILGSIYSIDLPDESIDFAVTRLVIEHLQEPMKAFAELRRILKPDGILVVVSNDFAYHVLTYPVIPELDEMFDAYNRSRFFEGGNPLIARQLPVLFQKAGFKDINIGTALAHSTLKGDKAMLSAENVNISRSLVKEGFLKAETLERLLQKWFEMLQNPDHVIFRQLFVIGGKKDSLAKNMDFEFKSVNTAYTNLDKTEMSSAKSTRKILSPADISEYETIILNVWQKVLSNNAISKTDNFFEIGGNSVMIPEILQVLENEHSLKLSILNFFQYPTVQLLATAVGVSSDNKPDETGETDNFENEIAESSNRLLADGDQQENSLAKIKAQRDRFKNLRK